MEDYKLRDLRASHTLGWSWKASLDAEALSLLVIHTGLDTSVFRWPMCLCTCVREEGGEGKNLMKIGNNKSVNRMRLKRMFICIRIKKDENRGYKMSR
jgi:hypothetical protein